MILYCQGGLELSPKGTTGPHATVFVGDDWDILTRVTLDIAARLAQLGDLVPAAVMDEDLSMAHLFFFFSRSLNCFSDFLFCFVELMCNKRKDGSS